MSLAEEIAKYEDRKFANLMEYFKGLSRDDLAELTEDDLIESVEPKDKIRMKLLIKHHLQKFLQNPNPFDSLSLVPRFKTAPSFPIVLEGILDLKKKEVSKKFKESFT